MKGYKFYLEYLNHTEKHKATVKNPGNHTGNVVAVLDDSGYHSSSSNDIVYDAIGGLFLDTPDSVVCSTGVSRDYLSECCKRIPEKLAREIHPKLFVCLDGED